ncbi:MAG: hypothetical protein AB7U38_04645 [Hyphomicrobiales bacterium]
MSKSLWERARALGTPRHHFESAMAALLGTPWWAWFVPFLIGGCVLLLMQTPLGWITDKRIEEVLGPIIMGITAAIAIHGYWRSRGFLTLILAIFCCALFFREWHFWSSSTGFVLAFAFLLWWASMGRDELKPWLAQPRVRGLLTSAMWTYFISQVLDRNILLSLPDYLSWHNNVEETLENSGHLMVLALVLTVQRAGVLTGGVSPARPLVSAVKPRRARRPAGA